MPCPSGQNASGLEAKELRRVAKRVLVGCTGWLSVGWVYITKFLESVKRKRKLDRRIAQMSAKVGC